MRSATVNGNVRLDGTPDSDTDEAQADNRFKAVMVKAPTNHGGLFTLNPDGSFERIRVLGYQQGIFCNDRFCNHHAYACCLEV